MAITHASYRDTLPSNGLGPVCVGYSKMGKMLGNQDKTYPTHEEFYNRYPDQCDLFVIENVPEYPKQTVEKGLGKGFKVQHVTLDPRNLGMGVGRARSYFVAWRTSKIKWTASFSLAEFLDCLSCKPVLTARNYFWQSHPKDVLTDAEDPGFKRRWHDDVMCIPGLVYQKLTAVLVWNKLQH